VMPQSAVSQQKSPKEQLVATWTLVAWDQRNADGTKFQQFGASPKGIAFFDNHYMITVRAMLYYRQRTGFVVI
jgi:hypothetical protein